MFMRKVTCVEDTYRGNLSDFVFVGNKKLKWFLKYLEPGAVLWVYGESCSGKSFLGQCIQAESLRQGRSCVRVSSDEFIKDVIKSICEYGSPENYYQKFYDADVIVIDEAEGFRHRESTQLEIAYVISRVRKRAQVVLLGLYPPEMEAVSYKEIRGVTQFFKAIGLESLDYRGRKRFVRRTLRRAHVRMNKADVRYICENAENMGTVVGMLNGVLSGASAFGKGKLPDLYKR